MLCFQLIDIRPTHASLTFGITIYIHTYTLTIQLLGRSAETGVPKHMIISKTKLGVDVTSSTRTCVCRGD